MQKTIKPTRIRGTVAAPGSKSLMQRAIAIATLAKGTSTLFHIAECDDCDAAIRVAKALGARTELKGRTLTIHPNKQAASHTIDCGESGLGLRMFTSLAALQTHPIELTGGGSLSSRPMGFFDDVLSHLGVTCKTNDGKLPIEVTGPMRGGEATIDGSLSSQFLTGLLIALPKASQDSTLQVNDLKSIPYIDMTLETMEHFGVRVDHDYYQQFRIAGNQSYRGSDFNIDGDWSGAAFLFVAGAIAGDIRITGLQSLFPQADEAIVLAMSKAGVYIERNGSNYSVQKTEDMVAFRFDATHCPDLFPPLVALACHAKGVTRLIGVHRLAHKESDRAAALIDTFSKMGHRLWIEEDELCIEPGEWQEAEVSSHGDHRIAMAAAVAALGGAKVTIDNAESVGKSWTKFWDDLEGLFR